MADSLDDIFGPPVTQPQSNGQSLDDILGPAHVNTPPSVKDPNFLQRFGSDLSSRYQNVENLKNQYGAGKINFPSAYVGAMGQVGAGALADLPTEMGKSLASGVGNELKNEWHDVRPEIRQPIEGAISTGVNYLKNSVPGQFAADMAHSAGEDFSSVHKQIEQHPSMKAVVEGGANIVNAGLMKPVMSGITQLGKDTLGAAVSPVTNPIKSALLKANTIPEEHVANFWQNKVTPEQAKHVAGLKYDYADKVGGALSPEKNDQFIDSAYNAIMPKEGKYNFTPSPVVKDVLDEIGTYRGTPLTLRDAQQAEEYINKRISYQPNGMLTGDSVDLLKIKKALRNTINSATEADMLGGSDGWQAWQDGKKAWSAAGILTDINNITNKSVFADQPAASLKRNLARWGSKSSKIAGLDPEEMDLVKDAIKNDFAHDLIRTGSSRLVPIGTAALGLGTGHGLLGAMGGTATSWGGRNLGFARQLAKMGDLVDAIGSRLPENPAGYSPTSPQEIIPPLQITNQRPQTVMDRFRYNQGINERARGPVVHGQEPTPQPLLPSPEKMRPNELIGAGNEIRPQTPEEYKAAVAARQRAAVLGLTPDVQANNWRNYFRKQYSPTFDAMESSSKKEKMNQIADMYAKKESIDPRQMRQWVEESLADQQYTADALDQPFSSTAIAEALKRATGKAKGGRIAFKLKKKKK